jgi:hypothetical protein
VIGPRSRTYWYGDEPFALEKLFEGVHKATVISSIALSPAALHRRLKTAAIWLSKAHWSSEASDAALALGIALDAMLAEGGPSPGRVLNERFALLEGDPLLRSGRFKRMEELFAVRSSVAHGGKSSAIERAGFITGMADEVRWVARRLLQLAESHSIDTEAQHKKLFEDLRWGLIGGRDP